MLDTSRRYRGFGLDREGSHDRATTCDITERKRIEKERELLIDRLQEALANIKTLRGMLRICTSCQRVMGKDGQWQDLQRVVCTHTEAEFRPDLCFTCGESMFPGFYKRWERSH